MTPRPVTPLTGRDVAVLGLTVVGCAAGGAFVMLAILRATGRL